MRLSAALTNQPSSPPGACHIAAPSGNRTNSAQAATGMVHSFEESTSCRHSLSPATRHRALQLIEVDPNIPTIEPRSPVWAPRRERSVWIDPGCGRVRKGAEHRLVNVRCSIPSYALPICTIDDVHERVLRDYRARQELRPPPVRLRKAGAVGTESHQIVRQLEAADRGRSVGVDAVGMMTGWDRRVVIDDDIFEPGGPGAQIEERARDEPEIVHDHDPLSRLARALVVGGYGDKSAAGIRYAGVSEEHILDPRPRCPAALVSRSQKQGRPRVLEQVALDQDSLRGFE